MQQLLFIGSTVADVVVRTPLLPQRGEDVNIISQRISLGGCAYNAFQIAHLTGTAPCTLFSPVGTGVWGDWVFAALQKQGKEILDGIAGSEHLSNKEIKRRTEELAALLEKWKA